MEKYIIYNVYPQKVNEKKQACGAANCHSTGAAKYILGTRIN